MTQISINTQLTSLLVYLYALVLITYKWLLSMEFSSFFTPIEFKLA